MIECYAITTQNLPDPVFMPEEARKVAAFIDTLKGLVGYFPHPPEGTVLFFKTLDDARFARAQIAEQGNECGYYILRARINEKKHEVHMMETVEYCGPVQ